MGDAQTTRELLPADTALPAVNTLLRLLLGPGGSNALVDAVTRVALGQAPDADGRVDDGMADLPTRVEDVIPAQRRGRPARVVIAAPRYVGDLEQPPSGAPCALVWATQRGVIELPTAYLDAHTLDQGLRVWALEVTGDAVRIQRRSFVRVPISVSVTVVAPAGAEDTAPIDVPVTLQGRTLDLSEGGVRCLLPTDIPADLPVNVVFAVDGEEFRLQARVVRSAPARSPRTGDPLTHETAIRFVDHASRADDLRRVVFAEQLRLRRSELR